MIHTFFANDVNLQIVFHDEINLAFTAAHTEWRCNFIGAFSTILLLL